MNELFRVMAVSKVPSTRLAMSESGSYIAVGSSDGKVHVVEELRFDKVSRYLGIVCPCSVVSLCQLRPNYVYVCVCMRACVCFLFVFLI
jgi:hypothetical protein